MSDAVSAGADDAHGVGEDAPDDTGLGVDGSVGEDDGDELVVEIEDDDSDGNRVVGGTARAALDFIARSLVDDPDAVVIETDERSRAVRFRVRVAPGDMGRMIGRRGRVAQAIRTVVRVGGARDGVDTNVDFVDD